MLLQENTSLKPFHTFGLDVSTHYLVNIRSESELMPAINASPPPRLILGGGSNMLFVNNWPGTVLKNEILGREIVSAEESEVIVRLGGGENWHQVVLWTLDQGLGGLENLSLIPGTVGAAPIQNIGAYGVELKDVFHQLEAVNLITGKKEVFNASDCDFGYRNSVFKNKLKGKYFITYVLLKLRNANFVINKDYGAIQQILEEKGINNPGPKDISDAVITIRSSKLPDPAKLGNSGSFFKNPVIPKAQLDALQKDFPHIVFYPQSKESVKVPAGWLIEQCGWKGKRIGRTGAHKDQALVLVNYGGASGEEVWQLAQDIQQSVRQKFGIELEPEVNVLM